VERESCPLPHLRVGHGLPESLYRTVWFLLIRLCCLSHFFEVPVVAANMFGKSIIVNALVRAVSAGMHALLAGLC